MHFENFSSLLQFQGWPSGSGRMG